jgi:NADH-quinone oxidoreductase subunit J
MVLFLSIIMLLDLRAEERRRVNIFAFVGGGLVAVAFVAQIWMVLQRFEAGKTAFLPLPAERIDDVRNVGRILFSTHNLPFQVIGVLILVATIGVVVLSKRELK